MSSEQEMWAVVDKRFRDWMANAKLRELTPAEIPAIRRKAFQQLRDEFYAVLGVYFTDIQIAAILVFDDLRRLVNHAFLERGQDDVPFPSTSSSKKVFPTREGILEAGDSSYCGEFGSWLESEEYLDE